MSDMSDNASTVGAGLPEVEAAAVAAAVDSAPAVRHPLAVPHVRNVWIGSFVSLLGDQAYLVALPWLVLQLTGSGVALGTVLMTTAVPRAVLMLAGGAVTDRLSARRVLIASAAARTVLVGAVAALIWLGVVRLWHLYLLTFAFGVADAFSLPAGAALIPTLVEDERQLGATNALMQGATTVAQMAGPAPAGLVVRAWGVAAALFFDAVSFLGVIVALWRVPEPKKAAAAAMPGGSGGGGAAVPALPGGRPRMLASIAEGLRVVRDDPALRALMGLNAALYLLIYGPLIVGLAAAAKFRFGSAAAFGSCVAAMSAGMLVGVVLGGRVKQPHHRGLQFIGMSALCGATLLGIGLVMRLGAVLAFLVLMGMGAGFVSVQFNTWVQTRVERAMLGRVTSLLLVSAVGLIPVSYAVSGVLAQWNLEALFVLAGSTLMASSVLALASRSARSID
jgi:MFS family permease